MNGPYCQREPDVLRAVARAWCEDADSGVAAHAATCARCTEVRRAAELLRASFMRDTEAARVPSAAAMWWRLERRHRYDQARRMQRIAIAVQAFVLACAAGVAVTIVQIAAPWLHSGSGVLRRWDGMGAAMACELEITRSNPDTSNCSTASGIRGRSERCRRRSQPGSRSRNEVWTVAPWRTRSAGAVGRGWEHPDMTPETRAASKGAIPLTEPSSG